MSRTVRVWGVRPWAWALAALAALSLAACGGGNDNKPAATTQASAGSPAAQSTAAPTKVPRTGPKDVLLATTTSTQDSGLLDVLVPEFEKETGYNVKVIAVGTGQALAMGDRGDADVLLVHAPSSETALIQDGSAINRRLVMHNDFIIVGPKSDPAGIKGMSSATDALQKIADKGSRFVSRGDDSGTDKLEKSLWKKLNIDPKSKGWYEETGQGMGATLQVANQHDGYTISDRATFLAQSDNLDLVLLVEKDNILLNVYSVMQVNPDKFSGVNAAGGKAFADFMLADKTQQMIADFGQDKYHQPLFIPDANKTYADLGL